MYQVYTKILMGSEMEQMTRTSISPKLANIIYFLFFMFVFLGGYTVGPKSVIDLLRNRSRPYLFSNSLPPAVVACASKVFEMLTDGSPLVEDIQMKTKRHVINFLTNQVSPNNSD